MSAKSQNKQLLIGGSIAFLLIVVIGVSAVWSRMQEVMEKQEPEKVAAKENLSAGNFKLGEELPNFTVTDEQGNDVDFRSMQDSEHFTVVSFHHPDCPCSENCGRLISEMEKQGYDDVRVMGILADGTRSERVLKSLEEQKQKGIVTFPVFYDHDQSVKELLGATRTPEMWVLDKEGKIAFYGAPESSLFPGSEDHRYLLREAIDALRKGEKPEVQRYEPIGCPIGG